MQSLLKPRALTSPHLWQCGDTVFDLRGPTLVMGIINVTPDSFSDAGQCYEPHVAIRQGLRLVNEGADILDIGGESTRPGAAPVSADVEMERVLPVIKGLRAQTDIPISIDTTKAAVAQRAIDAGATIVNDISALRDDPAMTALAARTGVGVILMHMQGTPQTMQRAPHYEDVVHDVHEFLLDRMHYAMENGIAGQRIILDPGIGFGKTLQHNLELMRRLGELAALPRPLMIGASRKSFIGKALDLPIEDRIEGTAAVTATAIIAGVRIIRVHDVKAMVRVARMIDAIHGRLTHHA